MVDTRACSKTIKMKEAEPKTANQLNLIPRGELEELSNYKTEVIRMTANLRRYELTDSEWERIKGYFEEEQKTGRPRSDMRTMLNGIIWIARSGAPWRDMPERYGPYTTVYGWYAKWQESGLIERMLSDLGVDADLQDVSLDSTCAKVHQHAAGAKKGLKAAKITPSE